MGQCEGVSAWAPCVQIRVTLHGPGVGVSGSDFMPRYLQGRSVKDSTLRRAQRRSFTPASFMEEDTVDFPDELDTSFFARVRGRAVVWY